MLKSKTIAKLKFKLREFVRTLPYHCLVMGSVFIVATIFDKYIEALCFLISFFSLRYKFPTTYHAQSIIVCMVLTNSIFGLSIVICPPIAMYTFMSVLLAYVDCLLLWLIEDRIEIKKAYDSLKQKLEQKKEFNVDTCTQDELIARCKELGFSEDKINLCIELFIKKTKQSKLADDLCVEEQSISKQKMRIKSKLNKID